MTKKEEHKKVVHKYEKKDSHSEKGHKNLEKDLEIIKKNAEEYLMGWKRSQADYANLKRRVETDMKDLASFTNADLISKLLPVSENFRRAFKHIPKSEEKDDWVQGIKQVEKQLEDILKGEGLEKIEILGEEFDPAVCEAISFENSKNHKDNEVIEIIETGYKLKDKVLKTAKVKICKK